MPERSDISPRGLAIGAAIVAGGIAAALGAAWLISAQVDAPRGGPSQAEAPRLPAPALQTAPRQDLAAFLREKNERLHAGGPVEGEPSRVRIPIEQAMRMMVESSRR